MTSQQLRRRGAPRCTTAVRAAALVITFAALLATAACDTNAAGEPTPTTTLAPTPIQTASPSTSTPTPSASPKSPTDQAHDRVVALVKKYYEVDQAIATDKKVPLDRYYEVAGGDYVVVLLKNGFQKRRDGYQMVGNFKLTDPFVDSLSLKKSKSNEGTASVGVCVDVSKVNVVDKDGKSVVSPERSPAYNEKLRLAKLENGWRVVDASGSGTSSCAV